MSELPAGYVVTVEPGDRIHFQDWTPGGVGAVASAARGVLLIHGLSQTSWIWAPVARRLAASVPTVAMDLRGHGLSDAPTEDGAYDLDVLAGDVEAVAEGSGLLDVPGASGASGASDTSVVLVGHGFGAIVAVAGARALGRRCAGVVLIDGGWEQLEEATGLDVEEFLRGLDEPPEVMASLRAFLADRAAFDPATWDDDQDRAARATVVETHAGRVVPATRPHALEATVRTMFAYDPVAWLPAVEAPVVVLTAADDEERTRARALAEVGAAREAAGRSALTVVPFGHVGHNLMRYRPAEVTDAVRSLAAPHP